MAKQDSPLIRVPSETVQVRGRATPVDVRMQNQPPGFDLGMNRTDQGTGWDLNRILTNLGQFGSGLDTGQMYGPGAITGVNEWYRSQRTPMMMPDSTQDQWPDLSGMRWPRFRR